jgi:hypothetical protein
MVWIDYQKAFDRVPHSWVIKSLELIGINNKLIAFTTGGHVCAYRQEVRL